MWKIYPTRKIREITDYIFDNYINEKFPLKIWSEFNDSTMQNTNSCELFHSHFNSMFYTAYLSVPRNLKKRTN
ncbi:Uncharacterized protein FWK35_00026900 [Aphis craccivora]|uniref:MULE domain-containing protein n=1 Tax=Aphis craccivora TaxID=307492 RepID=A0A6G0XFX3_APHCR|nr:Uncharacterized protein FWK35_00026900 [Aphis craccivora]